MFFQDDRCDDVQSLAPRRLTKGHEPERFQTLLHFFRRFDNYVESDVWRGVEIENQPARNRWMALLVIPRVVFDRSNLSRCNQSFDGVELNIGLSVSTHLTRLMCFDTPNIACRWKNRSPSIPSGVRMIEHGLPLRCSIIQGPTRSKYCASSIFEYPGNLSPGGQSILSGLEMTVPSTTLPSVFSRCRLPACGSFAL